MAAVSKAAKNAKVLSKTQAKQKNTSAGNTKIKKPNAKSPTIAIMVNAAIKELNEHNGSSVHAIRKYLGETYKATSDIVYMHLKKYLRSAVIEGRLVQTRGHGAYGSFRLASQKKLKALNAAAKAKKLVNPSKKKASPGALKKQTDAKKKKPVGDAKKKKPVGDAKKKKPALPAKKKKPSAVNDAKKKKPSATNDAKKKIPSAANDAKKKKPTSVDAKKKKSDAVNVAKKPKPASVDSKKKKQSDTVKKVAKGVTKASSTKKAIAKNRSTLKIVFKVKPKHGKNIKTPKSRSESKK